MKWITRHLCLYACIFLCSFTTALAATNNETSAFPAKNAYLLLEHTLNTANASHHSLEELRSTIDQLSTYQVAARTCVERTTQQLNALDQQLTALMGATSIPAPAPILKQMHLPRAAKKTTPVITTFKTIRMALETQKTTLLQQQSECQLFLLQSTQAIDTLNRAIQHRAAQKLLTPHLPLWDNLYYTIFEYKTWIHTLQMDTAVQFKTAPILSLLSNQYIWLAWLCLSAFFIILFGV